MLGDGPEVGGAPELIIFKGGRNAIACISPALDRISLRAKNKRAGGPALLPALARQAVNQIDNETTFRADQACIDQLEELQPVHRWLTLLRSETGWRGPAAWPFR